MFAKDTLDQWIYYLKNNEIKDDFTAKGMKNDNIPTKQIMKYTGLSEEEIKLL